MAPPVNGGRCLGSWCAAGTQTMLALILKVPFSVLFLPGCSDGLGERLGVPQCPELPGEGGPATARAGGGRASHLHKRRCLQHGTVHVCFYPKDSSQLAWLVQIQHACSFMFPPSSCSKSSFFITNVLFEIFN